MNLRNSRRSIVEEIDFMPLDVFLMKRSPKVEKLFAKAKEQK